MNNYPIIKFTLYFIIGILLQSILSLSTLAILIITFLLLISNILLVTANNVRFKQLVFVTAPALIVLTSMLFTSIPGKITEEYPYDLPIIKSSTIIGEVVEIDLVKDSKWSFVLISESIKMNDDFDKTPRKIVVNLFFEKFGEIQNLYDSVDIGDIVYFDARIIKPAEARNPGEFNYYEYLKSVGISIQANIYKPESMKIVDNSELSFSSYIHFIRKNVDSQILRMFIHETAALIRGLLLADRGNIDFDLRQSFVNVGVIHVLAVSGLHVGFIIFIFYFLFSRLNTYSRYWMSILGIVLFMILTNFPTSVVRASIMAVAMILSLLSNRSYNSLNALALAAMIILLINPDDLFDPGFQLSFSSVCAIVILYPKLKDGLGTSRIRNKYLRGLLDFLLVSISAQIGTLPFTIYYFGKFSLAGIFANLIVIPLIGIILGSAILTLVISVITVNLGQIFGSSVNLLSEIMFWIIKIFDSAEYSFIRISGFSVWDGILFFMTIIMFVFFSRFLVHRLTKFIIFLLLAINFLIWAKLDNSTLIPNNILTVMAIDVGQGDACLVKTPNGKIILIDSGNATPYFDSGERTIIPILHNLEIEKIDYALISHVDSDHYKGIFSLVKAGYIKEVFKPQLIEDLKKDIEFEDFLSEFEIPIHYYDKSILELGNIRLFILNHRESNTTQQFDANNSSGIIKLVYGNCSILFMGDAEIPAEKYYGKVYGKFVDSDILKVGHHGSKTSSSDEFLNLVSPKIALISCGIMNKFKHPSAITLDKMNEKSVEIYRTDESGCLIFQSDGNDFRKIDWFN
ncbi:MAG: DNA internalization-related competence protein ComEC/Rec2 [Melioribacteraceae bacterium]|nr:DNA internalization-related competence protein ComEC/Rec2 [Melioribacteraceae bacterium]